MQRLLFTYVYNKYTARHKYRHLYKPNPILRIQFEKLNLKNHMYTFVYTYVCRYTHKQCILMTYTIFPYTIFIL